LRLPAIRMVFSLFANDHAELRLVAKKMFFPFFGGAHQSCQSVKKC